MKTKPSLGLMVVMLMFPQIVETIYSPALGSIADTFSVSYAQAAQTLSVYFVAFALGVVTWGVMADKLGRRPTMLIGLVIYSCSALVAMQTLSFTVLILARVMSAFGIAVGSVVTQTMLRDAFDGNELAKVFSLMGMGIALSPVVGMLLGGYLTSAGGYHYVFLALTTMALALFVYNLLKLPETQTENQSVNLRDLTVRMVKDPQVIISAVLVALYNIALFSYYQLGAFRFSELGLSAELFGYSGIALGLATLMGSYVNKVLLTRNASQHSLLLLSALLLAGGAVGVYVMLDTLYFVVAMMLVVMSFGIAIPNILSSALVDYKQYAGSAGAVFGLLYYLMIGSGLALTGFVQNLGYVLLACSVVTSIVTLSRR